MNVTIDPIHARRVGTILITMIIALSACPQLRAEEVTYFQNGFEFDAFTDDQHVVVVFDDSASLTEHAVSLSAAGLSTSLEPFGDSNSIGVIKVPGEVSPAKLDQIAQQQGVVSVYPVLRFREDSPAVGIASFVIVKLANGVNPAELELQYGLEFQPEMTSRLGLPDVVVFDVLGASGAQVMHRAETLRADPRVKDQFAHADLVAPMTLFQDASDELFGRQWHLNNTGQFGSASTLADIDILDAWEITLGQSARVGMFDDACDLFHEDLASNYIGISSSAVGQGDADVEGNTGFHGTAVMGLMAASANQIGVRGVAPEASFTATRGVGQGASLQAIAAAFTFAVNQGVDVHNNSWGFTIVGFVPEVIQQSIQNAAINGRDGLGMVIFFAAGNESSERDAGDALAGLADVIQVGATGYQDTIAGYSNYGETQDIMGPSLGNDGIGLVTTDITGSFGFNSGNSSSDLIGQPNYTRRMSGTSGASPVVAGVGALVVDVNPNLNRDQVRELLTHTTDRVSPLDAQYGGVSPDAVIDLGAPTGFSLRYGYGRVNAAKAVEAAQDSRNGNTVWPGIPQDINANVREGPEDDPIVNISWKPAGMTNEDGELVETDEQEVLILYKVPGADGPADIGVLPVDGEEYEGCDPNDIDLCQILSIFESNTVVLFRGAGEPVGGVDMGPDTRRELTLTIAGQVDGAQEFAMFALNNRNQYSFGVVFNEDGERVGEGPERGDSLVPPDLGRPVNPELNPDEPGRTQPPSVAATSSLSVGTAPLTVSFAGNPVTPNAIIDRGWSFGDGGTSAQDNVEHTFDLPGSYSAVFFAEDEFNRISTKRLLIEVLDPADEGMGPAFATADIRVLSSGPFTAPNAQVRFTVDTTGIGTSSFESVVEYMWDFGDGTRGTGKTTENIYANPGFYSVVVIITETLSNGQITTVQDSMIVEIGGTSAPTSSAGQQAQQPAGGVNQGSGGSALCGAMGGTALLACLFLSLAGLKQIGRRRLRPRV